MIEMLDWDPNDDVDATAAAELDMESAADDTRREDEPGDWFIAEFDERCSRGGHDIVDDVTIRADGAGGWECRECVDGDQAWTKEDDEALDPDGTLADEVLAEMRGER